MPTRHPLTKKQSCMSQKKGRHLPNKKTCKAGCTDHTDLQDSYNFLEIRA